MSEFRPRPAQQAVLEYSGGKMGVSAVPGSGKTQTLAALAAGLVSTGIQDDQEVLVVTLVNSAVDNLKKRIDQQIRARQLLPHYGYRVRTLHGLAHDIVRERPGLVGLADDFGILDERAADAMRADAAEAWIRAHPDMAEVYLSRDLEGHALDRARRTRWPNLIQGVAAAFISGLRTCN